MIAAARIVGAVGVRGVGRIHSLTDDPNACFEYGPLLNAEGTETITPVKVERRRPREFAVTCPEIGSREAWLEQKGRILYLRRVDLPPAGHDEYYVCDLVGCAVEHADGRALGTVRAVHDFGAGDILEIGGIADFMLPFTRALVASADPERRSLVVQCGEEWLPDGLSREAAD